GNRLSAILDGLSKLSNIAHRELHLRKVELRTVLLGAQLQMSNKVSNSGMRILSDSLPSVHADEEVMTEVVCQLLDNALKFRSESNLEVEVKAERNTDGEVLVSVRDNGIGVEPAYHQKCFMLFKRLHSQSEYPGEGVGLAYCKKAIERQGGKIWMESNVAAGVTIWFTLPAWQETGDH
ncbi:MAG: ATP-binding protein, partial [Bryobacteraceae bacterium]